MIPKRPVVLKGESLREFERYQKRLQHERKLSTVKELNKLTYLTLQKNNIKTLILSLI